MRYDNDGNPIADFILNNKPFDQAKILVAEKNFGSRRKRSLKNEGR